MNDRSFLVLGGRAALIVAGEDRQTFLQGLVSNDTARISPSRAIYASLLTAQGRFLHDFFIADLNGAYVLDAEAARIDDLRKRLMLYRLRSKVTITAANESHTVVAAFGGGALPTLGLREPGQSTPFADGVAFVDPRLAGMGARLVIPRDKLPAVAAAGFTEAAPIDYERLRLDLGVPDGSRDMPVERALLLENGFDELNGVDWKKGCYIGQEVTARMKYRALVKKRLTPVRIEGAMPEPGAPILLDDEEAGEMRSAADGRGLALLRLDAIEAAEREGKKLRAGDAILTPFKPAWAA